MEFEGELEPYKNAEVYRNLQPASLPNHVEKFLDFVDISEAGFLLLGCSNLTGRYWMGSLWYFIEPDAAPDVEKCLTGIDCETGVCAGRFLDDPHKVIIGEDSGNIQILTLCEVADEHTFHFSLTASACDHDDFITSLSVFKGSQRALSGSADFSVKVWNVDTMVAEHTFRPAHSHHVTGVAAQPTEDSSLFASCSLDSSTFLWDLRQPKPSSVLLEDEAMNAIDWSPVHADVLAVGNVSGEVCFLDIRRPKQKLSKHSSFQRPIHCLRFDKSNTNKLGVCADDAVVKILDCSDLTNPAMMYCDSRHMDFVRGLAWHPKTNVLYSCGWDKQVLMHKIFEDNSANKETNINGVAPLPVHMDINGS